MPDEYGALVTNLKQLILEAQPSKHHIKTLACTVQMGLAGRRTERQLVQT